MVDGGGVMAIVRLVLVCLVVSWCLVVGLSELAKHWSVCFRPSISLGKLTQDTEQHKNSDGDDDDDDDDDER